jgi:sugar lactone lactonase YvrE
MLKLDNHTKSAGHLDAKATNSGIWRILQKGGPAELLIRDELLSGLCPPNFLGYPIGANGIGYYHGDLYVANSEKGIIVRIPVLQDGSLGQLQVWWTLENPYDFPNPVPGLPDIAMPDGLTIDVHGNIYVALVLHNAIVRINADDTTQETVAGFWFDPQEDSRFAYLDTPSSPAFGTGKGGRIKLFVINLGAMQIVGPGLVKIETDIPGLPIP